jgi:hypothetical protein
VLRFVREVVPPFPHTPSLRAQGWLCLHTRNYFWFLVMKVYMCMLLYVFVSGFFQFSWDFYTVFSLWCFYDRT